MTNVPEAGVPETSVPDAPARNQASELRPELRNWCEVWKTCLQNVLSQVSGTASGKSAAFEISSQPLPAVDSDVWYTVVAGGSLRSPLARSSPARARDRSGNASATAREPSSRAPSIASPNAWRSPSSANSPTCA